MDVGAEVRVALRLAPVSGEDRPVGTELNVIDGEPLGGYQELVKADRDWTLYLKVAKRPDPSLANTALQIYDPTALNRPKSGQKAALILARSQNTPEAYLKVVQWASLAKDTRTADLAGQKAEDLAPKSQKKQVKAAVKQAKAPPQAGAQTTGAGG